MTNGRRGQDPEAGFGTRAIHAGEAPDPVTRAHNTPIYLTATFTFETGEEKEAAVDGALAWQPDTYFYSRTGNPTTTALERKLASLEGAEDAVVGAVVGGDQQVAVEGVLQPRPRAVVGAALHTRAGHEHDVAEAVVGAVVVVLLDPAAELAERHQRDAVGQRPEVGEERRDRAREVARVALHVAPLERAEVGVHVPVALVDGDHLGADAGADDPRDAGERLPERAAGVGGRRRAGRGVARRAERLGSLDGVAHRAASRSSSCWSLSPSSPSWRRCCCRRWRKPRRRPVGLVA